MPETVTSEKRSLKRRRIWLVYFTRLARVAKLPTPGGRVSDYPDFLFYLRRLDGSGGWT